MSSKAQIALIVVSILLGISLIVFIILYATTNNSDGNGNDDNDDNDDNEDGGSTITVIEIKGTINYKDGITFRVGVENIVEPTLQGNYTDFEIEPPLLNGLIMDTSNGIISGRLNAFSNIPIHYAVIATDTFGSIHGTSFLLTTLDAIPEYEYATVPGTGINVLGSGTVINYPISIVAGKYECIDPTFDINWGQTGLATTYGCNFSQSTGAFGGTVNTDSQIGFTGNAEITVHNGSGDTQSIFVLIHN